MTITAEQFKEATGRDPIQDDLERSSCKKAGEFMHSFCGWCERCNGPVFECGHRKEEKGK